MCFRREEGVMNFGVAAFMRNADAHKQKKPDDSPRVNVQVRPRTRFRDDRETSSKAQGYNAPAGISNSGSKDAL